MNQDDCSRTPSITLGPQANPPTSSAGNKTAVYTAYDDDQDHEEDSCCSAASGISGNNTAESSTKNNNTNNKVTTKVKGVVDGNVGGAIRSLDSLQSGLHVYENAFPQRIAPVRTEACDVEKTGETAEHSARSSLRSSTIVERNEDAVKAQAARGCWHVDDRVNETTRRQNKSGLANGGAVAVIIVYFAGITVSGLTLKVMRAFVCRFAL